MLPLYYLYIFLGKNVPYKHLILGIHVISSLEWVYFIWMEVSFLDGRRNWWRCMVCTVAGFMRGIVEDLGAAGAPPDKGAAYDVLSWRYFPHVRSSIWRSRVALHAA